MTAPWYVYVVALCLVAILFLLWLAIVSIGDEVASLRATLAAEGMQLRLTIANALNEVVKALDRLSSNG